MALNDPNQVAIVIPTLQLRLDYLRNAIDSALECSVRQIIVVCPSPPKIYTDVPEDSRVVWILSEASLPEAINLAVHHFHPSVTHFGWIGDDDLLLADGYRIILGSGLVKSLTIGHCWYLDEEGRRMRLHKPSRWRLSRWALVLFASPIAQPASIISKEVFLEVGGIDANYKLAFDQDLFTKIIMLEGPPSVVRISFAAYREHASTLSNDHWRESLAESAQIRISHAPSCFKWAIRIFEVLRATYVVSVRFILPKLRGLQLLSR